MKTITVAGSKGGISKTSLALCMAQCLAQNYTTCIVDVDPQGTLRSFKDMIGIDVVEIGTDGYDVTVIDTQPYLSNELPKIIAQSDYILLPCRPNAFDAVALKAMIPLVKNKYCGIVLTQVQHRVNISDVLDVLKEYNVPILKQSMSQRVSYARAGIQNLFDSDDVKAQKEILSIVLEVFATIK